MINVGMIELEVAQDPGFKGGRGWSCGNSIREVLVPCSWYVLGVYFLQTVLEFVEHAKSGLLLFLVKDFQSIARPAAMCVKKWSQSMPWVLLKQ